MDIGFLNFFGRARKSGVESPGANASSKKGVPRPSRKELLALRPVRNPELLWDEVDGRVVLRVRRDMKIRPGWKSRVANIFVQLPEERVVELDDIGSEVWRALDGAHSIGDIAQNLAKNHKLQKREAELSLQQFFKDLTRRGYIGFFDK